MSVCLCSCHVVKLDMNLDAKEIGPEVLSKRMAGVLASSALELFWYELLGSYSSNLHSRKSQKST